MGFIDITLADLRIRAALKEDGNWSVDFIDAMTGKSSSGHVMSHTDLAAPIQSH